MSEMNRRSFVAATAASVALVVLNNDLLGQATTSPASEVVDIGVPGDFAAGSVSDKFAKSDKVLVAHKDGKIYALTAICPHKKATVGIKDGAFYCASHKSIFDITGKVTGGPAPSGLTRHAIKLNDNGHLIVDKSKSFEEAKFTDPAAFYTVKASA